MILGKILSPFIGGIKWIPNNSIFHSRGRVNRSAYWLRYVLPVSIILVVVSFLSAGVDAFLGSALILICGILGSWISLAVAAKRYHDRDKSAWWILIALIPIIGSIWQIIELGFLKGTDGPNRFGSDPLAIDE